MMSKEYEKLVVNLDKMYIREDLVYDKHTGTLIGFASLSKVNDHLRAFEHTLKQEFSSSATLAKMVMTFIFSGLFLSLRHP